MRGLSDSAAEKQMRPKNSAILTQIDGLSWLSRNASDHQNQDGLWIWQYNQATFASKHFSDFVYLWLCPICLHLQTSVDFIPKEQIFCNFLKIIEILKKDPIQNETRFDLWPYTEKDLFFFFCSFAVRFRCSFVRSKNLKK